jgi:hypothetical protein
MKESLKNIMTNIIYRGQLYLCLEGGVVMKIMVVKMPKFMGSILKRFFKMS